MGDDRDLHDVTLPPLDERSSSTDETLPASATTPAPPGTRAAGAGEEADELCGRTVHHFKVIERIGKGGMGCVYRAHDLSLDRPVALKVIATARGATPELRERFFREARAQARLSHPNVVQIYYIGEQDGLVFFAMELVDGATLEDGIRRGEAMDPDVAVERMIAVAEALKLAHERGFIHRDVKPSNLLVDSTGVVKVADFGLAKPVAADLQLTQQGAVLGSPLYISPEAGRGDPADFRSDIYSLGATFYHLLTGRPPFFAETPIGVITKHITQPLPPVRSVRAGIPQALAAILERAMEKDPARRYQSYDELLGALAAARPQATTTAGFWVRAMALGADLAVLMVPAVLVRSYVWLLVPFYVIGGWWRYGQTVGKWLFRLQVRELDNQLPSLWHCAVRFLVFNWGPLAIALLSLVAWLTLPNPSMGFPRGTPPTEVFRQASSHVLVIIGYVAISITYLATMAIWTGVRRDRRGLHDRASGTMVVYHLGARSPRRAGR
jgi:uncharacterized RDD family membrane protein YckC/predicted Ser/Thr protein kinase